MINDDECESISGMRTGRGNRSTRWKPASAVLCPPQIPHDLTWARPRAASLGSWRLTSWAMARPLHCPVFFKELPPTTWVRKKQDTPLTKCSRDAYMCIIESFDITRTILEVLTEGMGFLPGRRNVKHEKIVFWKMSTKVIPIAV
jgi:hypothetical protein